MASIETLKNKRTTSYVVCFYRNGKKQKVSLCCVYSRRDAERLRDAVESALKAEKKEEPLDRATSLYFENLTVDMRRRLIKVGLIRGTQAVTLQEAKDLFFKTHGASLKPNTIRTYTQAFRVLGTVVPPQTKVDAIGRETILSLKDKMSEVYLPACVDSHLTRLKAFFNFLRTNEMIEKSPMEAISISRNHQGKREYVPADSVIKCFEHLTLERRAILALWRFAGLRREEPMHLTRECVDFTKNRLTIFSPKTARTGRSKRVAPMCQILADILHEHMQTIEGDMLFKNNLSDAALDAAFRKASVSWKRKAQNLRVSCENDWLEEGYPSHVVAHWIGHTVDVQNQHYAIVLDSYFEKATKRN